MTTVERLLYLLTIDGGGWLTIRQLATSLSVPRREVEEAIQALRLDGHPIATGQHGVRLVNDADELAESNRSLHHRLKAQYQTLRAQRKAERRLRERETSQPTLWALP